MDDRLEKFIKSHREEMDDKSPKKELWKEIEREITSKEKQKTIFNTLVYWRAAAVILLLISSLLVIDKLNRDVNGSEQSELVQISPQLMEAENYYVNLINQKKQEINVLGDQYDLSDDFLQEIQVLDSMYTVLKQDLQRGDEENLVNAMILNLQLRIEILNTQLRIIQSIENSQRNENIIL